MPAARVEFIQELTILLAGVLSLHIIIHYWLDLISTPQGIDLFMVEGSKNNGSKL
jgi:hypothetical protein